MASKGFVPTYGIVLPDSVIEIQARRAIRLFCLFHSEVALRNTHGNLSCHEEQNAKILECHGSPYDPQ